jgi:hypothetical protein
MLSVAVVVGDVEETGADLVQRYGAESGHRSRDAVLLWEGEAVARVLDLPWLGTDGANWRRASVAAGRVVLAGGLDPENVGAAIAVARPWAVDTARGVEASPGIKDHQKVRAFVEAARQ